MASPMQHAPTRPARRQRVAAWIAFALALIYPLTVAFNATVIVTRNLSADGNIVIESLYTALTYFEWPLPIIAIFVASLTLRDARRHNAIAWAAIYLGAASLLAIAGVVIVLAVAPHIQ
ncbi:MAG TPA: hypothetical protein VFN11_07435 [Ktedonobacterales bacterium]|nr:hypothetical protein [Ktedonobacterales bacterium]